MANQKTNPILEAYNAGKLLKRKHWPVWHWIKKHSETQSITSHDTYHEASIWCFDTKPETWEILPEDIEPETPPHPDEIQHAIDLLKANGYEIYQITKTKL